MRRVFQAFIKLWDRVPVHGTVVAFMDFLLLALAAYVGYAMRLGLDFPLPALYARDCLNVALIFPSTAVAVFAVFGQYRVLWSQAAVEEYVRFGRLYVLALVLFYLENYRWHFALFPRTSFAFMILSGIFFCGVLRVSWRLSHTAHGTDGQARLKTLIVGAGDAGALLARDLARGTSNMVPAAFVDDDPHKAGRRIAGLDVIGDTSDLAETVRSGGFQVVLIALPSVHGKKIRALYEQLAPTGVQVRTLPSLRELADGQVSVTRLRDIRLEDLLGRDPVRISLDETSNYIRGRRVLVTGAGGSIGSEIVRQVLQNGPSEVIVLGHGEQSIYLLLESLNKNKNQNKNNIPVQPVIADVADATALEYVFRRWQPQLVFHAAAHKHVPLMENSPREALRVNGIGTRTLARAAGKYKAERMVLISTDKAVNPSSVMGATKRVAEKVLEQEQRRWPGTAYMAVRFGNVLGSRGSVIPKFEEQIASGGPVTVTAPQMKRYFMLIPEAVSLVIQAGAMGHGGELFVLDMGEPVVIADMAKLLIRLYGLEPGRDIQIVFTGIRPGEKLEEELFYDPAAVHPTPHPKIFASVLDRAGLPDEELNLLLEDAVRQPEEALKLLQRLVPEYSAA